MSFFVRVTYCVIFHHCLTIAQTFILQLHGIEIQHYLHQVKSNPWAMLSINRGLKEEYPSKITELLEEVSSFPLEFLFSTSLTAWPVFIFSVISCHYPHLLLVESSRESKHFVFFFSLSVLEVTQMCPLDAQFLCVIQWEYWSWDWKESCTYGHENTLQRRPRNY